jgi:glycosyltransferase involved in cell wall biosynthesis
MDTSYKISIAIPTYNRADLLLRAVNSCLSQTYSNIEVIVSDNCSSDNSIDILRQINDPRLFIHTNKSNIGMKLNFQKCLNSSNGHLFLLLSDDDYFMSSSALEQFVVEFDKTEAKILISSVMLERAAGLSPGKYEQVKSDSDFLIKYFSNDISVFPCATMFDMTCLIDEKYNYDELTLSVDAFLLIKVIEKYKGNAVHFFDGKLIAYKIHNSESSADYKVWQKDLEFLKTHITKSTIVDKGKIAKALTESIDRAILGYLARKYKKKGITFSFLSDFIFSLGKIIKFSNLLFIFRRFFL